MQRHDERGIALVLALLLTSAMTVLGAGLMFLSQTETYATMNYRMMSQARYAAEAAIQRAGNYLYDRAQYVVPGYAGDPLTPYNYSSSPVTYNGQPVKLSSRVAASNYPVAAVKNAFAAAAAGTLLAGNATLDYGAEATLIAMQTFDAYGGTSNVVQTWRITGTGGAAGAVGSTIEVVGTIETPRVAAQSYAAFATGNTCGAMHFRGNVTINSYDSSTMTGATPTFSASGGHVGTNGNLHIEGSVAVQGNLSTPRTGVGSCTDGNVTALTQSGSATVTGSTVQLPGAVSYPPPVFTATPPTNTVTVNAALLGNPITACSSLGLLYGAPVLDGTTNAYMPTPAATCTVTGGNTVIVRGAGVPVTMPTVNVASGYTLRFIANAGPAQDVNINALNGSGTLEIQANMGATSANEAVVLKVAGKNPDGSEMTVPFDLETMGWKQNEGAATKHKYDASAVQIVYAGTQTINMDGGNNQSAVSIYAPNAHFILKGTQDLYGSVLAKTIENRGNASIHYDRNLMREFFVAGHPMASSFSWKRY